MLRKLGWFSLGFTFGPFFVKVLHLLLKASSTSLYMSTVKRLEQTLYTLNIQASGDRLTGNRPALMQDMEELRSSLQSI